MNACVLVLCAAVAAAAAARAGYEREIHAGAPQLLQYVLGPERLAAQKGRGRLVTRPRPADAVAADSVLLESNALRVLRPPAPARAQGLVRRRRGYNLENVRVPARYPYLPVPHYSRFRRWG